MGERDALQRELEELKKKLEGVKSRNKVLSSEVKTLRNQMGTLVEKGRHDDELIDALMVWPSHSRPTRARAQSLQHGPPPCPGAHDPAPVRVSPHLPQRPPASSRSPWSHLGTSPKATPQGQEQLRGCLSTRTRPLCGVGAGCDVLEPLVLWTSEEEEVVAGEGDGFTPFLIFPSGNGRDN